MFSFVFILCSCYFIVIHGQNSCQTPDNIPGVCIPIKSCSFIVDILQKETPVTSTTKTKLKKYQCGVENQTPKVCCPHKNMNLFNHTCAQSNNDKLFGGVVAFLFDYPWNILIAYNTDNGKEFLCEGSIINEKYVLTTAYCIKDLTQRFTLSHVRVGEHNLTSSPIDCEDLNIPNESYCGPPFQDVQISELIYHPNYNSSSNENNIGLIRLSKKLEFTSDTLAPICLPFKVENEIENKAMDKIMLNGWGTNNFAPQSAVLLKDNYKIIPIDECRRTYSRIAPQIKIDSNEECIEEKDLKRFEFYRCIGESGDSAYIPRIKSNGVDFVQYGIFTLGSKNCLNSDVPKVITKVEPYLNWILDSVKP